MTARAPRSPDRWLRWSTVGGLAMLALAGCRLDVELLEVPARGARSALLIELAADGSVRGEAIDLPQPDDLRFPAPAGGELYVLGFGCPLDALDLAAGPVIFGGERPLPSAAFTRRREGTAWVDEAVPSAALASVRLLGAQPSGCVSLDLETRTIPGTEQESPDAVASLGGDRFLMATRAGRVFVVDADSITQVALSTTTPRSAWFREDDGTVFAIGDFGVTARGGPGGFTAGPSMQTRAFFGEAWADGSGSGAALELFVLTPAGTVERFDGARFEQIDVGPQDMIEHGGVAWLGPGRAVVTGLGGARFLRIDGGAARMSTAALMEGDEFFSITRVPGHGVFAGTLQGYLYAFDGGTWITVVPRAVSPQLQAVAAVDDRLYFGGNGGALWQVVLPTRELCMPRVYTTSGVRFTLQLDDGFYLLARDRSNSGPIEIVRARRPAPSACEVLP